LLYSEEANLVFIHVPKNAGKSMRNAFARGMTLSHAFLAGDLGVDEARGEAMMDGEVDVPGIGAVKPAHLPLAIAEAHFPRTWATIRRARSFILVRSPRERFFSALMQRLGEFRDAGPIRADDPLVRDEARRVCEWLAGRGPFGEAEYIHFSRQADYADLRGERVVSAVFPVERIDLAARWVEAETGLRIDVAHDHARREPRKWAGVIQPAARFIGRRVMPRAMKKAIYPLWMNSGAFANAASRYDALDLGGEVEAFVAEYYACDALLHREALRGTEAPAMRVVA
jgi:hypothetical protein